MFQGAGLMSRTLIVIGILIALLGVLWPWLGKLGLGHLPGDIVIERGNIKFYFPIVTCLLISVVVTLVLWAVNYFGR
jgi:hypothetical protein